MIYSASGRVLFVHISRTGGTTIRHYLQKHLPDATTLLEQHDPILSAKPLLGERFEQTFKFAFVRNPWDRFVSWYALIGQSTQVDKAQLIEPGSTYWQGFDEFLELWSARTTTVNGIKRLELGQWEQLSDTDGNLLVDDWGRFETFNDDASRLLTRFGIKGAALSAQNTSSHHHYSYYYSDFGKELVQSVFYQDVQRFNYCFEPANHTLQALDSV